MERKVNIKRKNEYKVYGWSGGSTTELIIYPEDSNYNDRNFIWRISSASIEDEESKFTYLPGISRIIIPLSGGIEIVHNNSESISLEPFQKHFFMGDWSTKSYGRVTDFNVMTSKTSSSDVEVLELDSNSINISADAKLRKEYDNICVIFYVESGEVDLNIENKIETVKEGDLFYISFEIPSNDFQISLSRRENIKVRIIKAIIYF